MFPLYDSTPQRTFPFINYLIILLNIGAFILQITVPDPEAFINQYAFIPSLFHLNAPSTYWPIFTSMFLHGGFLHIFSNMMFLRIFGDNVEDALGHVQYLTFYLAAGFAATIAQYWISPDLSIPLIGASGAISGVAGAYFVMYRGAKIKTLVPVFGFMSLIDLSAGFFLGYWFVSQIFNGIGSITMVDSQSGGVAFFAHIGGFIFGYLFAKTLGKQEQAFE